jgi:hypothetical protein
MSKRAPIIHAIRTYQSPVRKERDREYADWGEELTIKADMNIRVPNTTPISMYASFRLAASSASAFCLAAIAAGEGLTLVGKTFSIHCSTCT